MSRRQELTKGLPGLEKLDGGGKSSGSGGGRGGHQGGCAWQGGRVVRVRG